MIRRKFLKTILHGISSMLVVSILVGSLSEQPVYAADTDAALDGIFCPTCNEITKDFTVEFPSSTANNWLAWANGDYGLHYYTKVTNTGSAPGGADTFYTGNCWKAADTNRWDSGYSSIYDTYGVNCVYTAGAIVQDTAGFPIFKLRCAHCNVILVESTQSWGTIGGQGTAPSYNYASPYPNCWWGRTNFWESDSSADVTYCTITNNATKYARNCNITLRRTNSGVTFPVSATDSSALSTTISTQSSGGGMASPATFPNSVSLGSVSDYNITTEYGRYINLFMSLVVTAKKTEANASLFTVQGNYSVYPSTAKFAINWDDWKMALYQNNYGERIYYGLDYYLSGMGSSVAGLRSSQISFSANGGTGAMEDLEVESGQSFTLSNEFTREGHEFLGWSTSSTGSVEFDDGETVTPSSSMTLYAVWDPLPYEVTLIDVDNVHGTELNKITLQKDHSTTVKGADWGSDTAVGAYYEGYAYASATSISVTTDVAKNVVYRYFTPQKYAVTVIDFVEDENLQLGSASDTVYFGDTYRGATKGVVSPYDGFSYIGDSEITVSVDADSNKVYRYFSRNSYDVKYIDIVKTGDYTVSGEILKNEAVEHKFGDEVSGTDYGSDMTVNAYYPGYYYTGESTRVVVSSDESKNVVSRYFMPGTFDVIYMDVAGSIASGRELGRTVAEGLYGEPVNAAIMGTDSTPDAYYTGYTYVSCTQGKISENGVTAYRIFSPVTYNITYELNEGTLENPIERYAFGESTELQTPTRPGYTFAGWYSTETLEGEPLTEISDTATGDIKLYADWKLNYYGVSLKYAGEGATVVAYRDGEEVTEDFCYGDTVVVNFGTRAQSQYVNSSMNESITDVVVPMSDTPAIQFTMPDEDVNIEVYWEQIIDTRVVTNEVFDSLFKQAPRWVGGKYDLDVTPVINVKDSMVGVIAYILNTETQEVMSRVVNNFAFTSNTMADKLGINTFEITADPFGNGQTMTATFQIETFSSGLNKIMSSSGTGSYTELEKFIEDMQVEIDELANTIKSTNVDNSNYKEQIEAAEKKAAELSAALATKQAELETKDNTSSTAVDAMVKETSELQQKISELNAELKASQSENNTLTKENNKLSSQLSNVEMSNDALKYENDALSNSATVERNELENKYEYTIAEKDTTIYELQQKIALLEDQLSKPVLGGSIMETLGAVTEQPGVQAGVQPDVQAGAARPAEVEQETATDVLTTTVQSMYKQNAEGVLDALGGFTGVDGNYYKYGDYQIQEDGTVVSKQGRPIGTMVKGKDGYFDANGGWYTAGGYYGPAEWKMLGNGEIVDLYGESLGAVYLMEDSSENSVVVGPTFEAEDLTVKRDFTKPVLFGVAGVAGLGSSTAIIVSKIRRKKYYTEVLGEDIEGAEDLEE